MVAMIVISFVFIVLNVVGQAHSLPLEKASIPTAEDIKRLVRATLGKKSDA